MSKLVKNYLLSLIYELFTIIVPLVTAPYLTRVLHADNYGIYSYVSSITSIILTLALLGVYSYGNRQVAYCRDNYYELSEIFWELMTLRLIMGIAGSLAFFTFASTTDFKIYFILYYGCFLANVFDCSWVFIGIENMAPCVIKNSAAKALTLIGIFIFVKNENDVGKYIFLVAMSGLLANIAVYSQLRGIIKKPVIRFRGIVNHLKGSVFLFLPQLASLLYLQIDKAMIQWLTSETSQISFYDQAEKIVTVALSVITVISTVMMPRIANVYQKGDLKRVESYLAKASRFSLLLAIPMTIGLQCTALQLVPWYLGNEYLPTAYAIIVISPIAISNSLIGISGRQFFVATNKITILTVSNSVSALLNVVVNAILIPKYGYFGAAIATTFSSFVNVVIQYHSLRKYIDIKKMFEGAFTYFAFSLIMGGVVLYATNVANMPAKVLTTIVQITFGIATYLLLLFLARDNLLKEAISMMKGLIRKRG